MKGMKIVSIILWLIIGALVLITDTVSRLNYGILLFLYLMESAFNLLGMYVHGE